MIEEKNNGEQPSLDVATSATNVGIYNLSPDSLEGSPLGKFKDVESLLKAYNNLHSEFTKKCQAYNELKRAQENNDNATPLFESDNWQLKVDEFLKNRPQAKSFTKQIAEEIASDKILQTKQNSLELAYSSVLEKENERLRDSLNSENKIRSLSDNDKEIIVTEYLNKINRESPFLMSSRGGNNIVSSYKKPISVNEAGEMAKKIFK